MIRLRKIKKAGGLLLSRHRATIIGAVGLDFRVRDGNGYGTHAMATGIKKLCQCLGHSKETHRRAVEREGTIWPSLAAY